MRRNPTLSEANQTFPTDRHWNFSDPWDASGPGQQTDSDNWLLGYVDVLTLMLTLLVMLLAFNHIENKYFDSAQASKAAERVSEATKTLEPQRFQRGASPGFSSVEASDSFDQSMDRIQFDSRVDQPIKIRPSPTLFRPHQPENLDSDNRDLNTHLLEESLIGLDLSVDPIEILSFSPSARIAFPAVSPLESQPPARSDRQDLPEFQTWNKIARFQRFIAERKLDELIDISAAPNAVRMEVNERILFDTGKADLKSRGQSLLDQLADLLKNQPGIIHIEGHTDNIPIANPRFPSNWELSASRASSVARYLIGQAIEPNRLRAIGFADTRPRAGNQTPEGRAKNRRVSLIIEMNDSRSNQDEPLSLP